MIGVGRAEPSVLAAAFEAADEGTVQAGALADGNLGEAA